MLTNADMKQNVDPWRLQKANESNEITGWGWFISGFIINSLAYEVSIFQKLGSCYVVAHSLHKTNN